MEDSKSFLRVVSHTAHAPLTTGCEGNLTLKLLAAKKCNKHRPMKHYKTTMLTKNGEKQANIAGATAMLSFRLLDVTLD